MIKARNLTLMQYYYLTHGSYAIAPIMSLYRFYFSGQESSLRSCITFGFYVVLIFHLEQFLSLPLAFFNVTFFKSTEQLFGRKPFNLGLPGLPDDYIQGIHFGQEFHKSGIVSFLVHHVRKLMILGLLSWTWYLPDFCAINTFFFYH